MTVTDQNATRDAVADPAATFVVSFAHSATNYSYTTHTFFPLPYALKVGGWWNLTITGATAGAYSASFFVRTYGVETYTDQDAYLSGHTANVTWQVRTTVNGSFASRSPPSRPAVSTRRRTFPTSRSSRPARPPWRRPPPVPSRSRSP